MTEPTGHCPYVGLKQNRAIRFAAPTPEHRCYITGEPLEIPVEQAHYCLSSGHIHCPLYTGSGLATMSEELAIDEYVAAERAPGLRGWLGSLQPRDRAVYVVMLALLLLIALVALIMGLRALSPVNIADGGNVPTAPAVSSVVPTEAPVAGVATITATAALPTPTDLPTSTPRVLPTETATQALILEPTQQPSNATEAPATTDTSAPTVLATGVVVTPSATSIPPTAAPASATPVPTATPSIATTRERVTLYFGDPTDTLFVPVARDVPVEDGQLAAAAIRALIDGPRDSLQRLIPANTQLLGLSFVDDIAVVNFNRRPSMADNRGLQSIIQTLVQLPNIKRVQFQVNGRDIGINGDGPDGWAPLNVLNPQNLPVDTTQATFLPLYFPAANGDYDIRIIRLVPPTRQTATATLRALIEGPGSYSGALRVVIPADTAVRAVALTDGIVTVNLSQSFANAQDRAAAVRTVVQSLTTLPTVQGVQFLVEGRSLGELWGTDYGQVFNKPIINAE